MSSPCCVCGGTARVPALHHAEGELTLCTGCGLVSVEPLPTPAAALAPYDAAYFLGDAGYRDYAAEEAVFRRQFRHRIRALSAAGCRGRLLDVGAATGAFLDEARKAGFSGTGVEPAAEIAAMARTRTGLEVFAGPVESATFPPASFDAVTCFDALEHMVDPVAALRRFHGWLAPEGRVALTVPDFGCLWARATGSHWSFVTPKEHLHYFTRETLARALAAAGFAPPAFFEAGVPVSLGSIAKRVPFVGRGVEVMLGPLAARGFSIPFGSLFAIAKR